MHIAIEGQAPTQGVGPGSAAAGEFDRVLQSVMNTGGVSPANEAAWQSPQIAPMGSVENVQASPSAGAAAQADAANMLDEAQAGYDRLNGIIERIRTEGPFNMQDLMGMQLEAYKITMQLETTTKAIAEAVNNTKQLLQQQI